MNKRSAGLQRALKILSYLLVAVLASAITWALASPEYSKLTELEQVLDEKFIDGMDKAAVEDAAADAMVEALGDRWSYYVPASELEALEERKNNEYVGVGITVRLTEDGSALELLKVEPEGGAARAGMLVGDLVTQVDDTEVSGLTMEGVTALIRGKEGTEVLLTVKRGEETLTLPVLRQTFRVPVARGEMLPGQVGLVTIANFNTNCADETIAAIDDLMEQGAQSLIFDVRNNGGGYVYQMTEILDHLLPEGEIFRSVDYRGVEDVTYSDESALDVPMAVLINGDTYSAAEFFAAVLREYDKAFLVGEHSVGKGHFQYLLKLSDGSAVNLSAGHYVTPNGVNLEKVGGLQPDRELPLSEEQAALLYSEQLEPMEDPQIQAALNTLMEGKMPPKSK